MEEVAARISFRRCSSAICCTPASFSCARVTASSSPSINALSSGDISGSSPSFPLPFLFFSFSSSGKAGFVVID
jgi:hypothetical protein